MTGFVTLLLFFGIALLLAIFLVRFAFAMLSRHAIIAVALIIVVLVAILVHMPKF